MQTPPDIFQPLSYDVPPFDQLREFSSLLDAGDWPSLDQLNARLAHDLHQPALRFVGQSQALFRDGLHFERRIFETGAIATRPCSWHDLFSALVWLRYPRLKLAMNALQVADLAAQGRGNRTRRQQSLTHLDEAGVLIVSEDPALLAVIDAHDWERLFIDAAADWGRHIQVHVVGHALFELMRAPHQTLAGKALLFRVKPGFCGLPFAQRAALLDVAAARAISSGTHAADPRSMPSLPLSGIPGWRPGNSDPQFVRSADCFRPRPPGRVYSAALDLIQ